jgi:parallel beta-helix repeat protein
MQTPSKQTWAVAVVVAIVAILPIQAQTPACGSTITSAGSVIIFDGDMVCDPGFSGAALTVRADNVTVDGAGFAIVAPEAGCAVCLDGASGCTASNINASGIGGVGYGIRLTNTSNNLITNNVVHGRHMGIYMTGTDNYNTISDNDLSGNNYGIADGYSSNRPSNAYTNNDVSASNTWGIVLSYQEGLSLGGNVFTGSANGLKISHTSGFTLDGITFADIPGTALQLEAVENATVTNIDASGSGAVGYGIRLANTSNNLITNNVVHGRHMGIYMTGTDNHNTISDNDLSGNNYGIADGYSWNRPNNAYTNNDVSASNTWGISLSYGENALIRGNESAGSASGIRLLHGMGSVVTDNAVTSGTSHGLVLQNESAAEVTGNHVSGMGGDGLRLKSSADARIYHNDIYGNVGYQVDSDLPIELSYGNEGNYWGRSCPPDEPFELFIAQQDSNAVDVIDSFPYGAESGWEQEIDPGCGPPPTGAILGEVWDDVGPVSGVTITLEDSGQTPMAETVTDGYGNYAFGDLEPGIYYVSLIVPIGYVSVSPTHSEAIVDSGGETPADFTVERLVVEVNTRSKGYWKHQAKANLTGRGHADESAHVLLDYLTQIHKQYDVFDNVVGLEGMLGVLEPPKPPTMSERAEAHLMTLLLNVTSLKIATYTEVSTDDDCGEAIDRIIAVLDGTGSVKGDLEAVKDLAEDVNNGLLPLEPGRIPEPEEGT